MAKMQQRTKKVRKVRKSRGEPSQYLKSEYTLGDTTFAKCKKLADELRNAFQKQKAFGVLRVCPELGRLIVLHDSSCTKTVDDAIQLIAGPYGASLASR